MISGILTQMQISSASSFIPHHFFSTNWEQCVTCESLFKVFVNMSTPFSHVSIKIIFTVQSINTFVGKLVSYVHMLATDHCSDVLRCKYCSNITHTHYDRVLYVNLHTHVVAVTKISLPLHLLIVLPIFGSLISTIWVSYIWIEWVQIHFILCCYLLHVHHQSNIQDPKVHSSWRLDIFSIHYCLYQWHT